MRTIPSAVRERIFSTAELEQELTRAIFQKAGTKPSPPAPMMERAEIGEGPPEKLPATGARLAVRAPAAPRPNPDLRGVAAELFLILL